MGTILASPLLAFLVWYQWLGILVIIGLLIFLKVYRAKQQ